MSNPLSRKRQRYVPLSETRLKLLAGPLAQGRVVAARADIIREGDDPRGINVILAGWACRYRQLVDGRRQNASLFLPGDACDPHMFLLEPMDHTIGAVTPGLLGQNTGSALQAMTGRSLQLDRAFHHEALAAAAVQRERTVSLGCRTGNERLALCSVRCWRGRRRSVSQTQRAVRCQSRGAISRSRWARPACTSTARPKSCAAKVRLPCAVAV